MAAFSVLPGPASALEDSWRRFSHRITDRATHEFNPLRTAWTGLQSPENYGFHDCAGMVIGECGADLGVRVGPHQGVDG